MIPAKHNYKEYAAAGLFYGGLAEWMRRGDLTKVSRWRFGLRYMQKITQPVVGGGPV